MAFLLWLEVYQEVLEVYQEVLEVNEKLHLKHHFCVLWNQMLYQKQDALFE